MVTHSTKTKQNRSSYENFPMKQNDFKSIYFKSNDYRYSRTRLKLRLSCDCPVGQVAHRKNCFVGFVSFVTLRQNQSPQGNTPAPVGGS